jgi:hypothetical protein
MQCQSLRFTRKPPEKMDTILLYRAWQMLLQSQCRYFSSCTTIFSAIQSQQFAPFGTKQFQLLPSTHILARLVGKTTFSRNGNLEIVADDFRIFRSFCNEPEKFKVATKLFAQRGKNKTAQESGG